MNESSGICEEACGGRHVTGRIFRGVCERRRARRGVQDIRSVQEGVCERVCAIEGVQGETC
eukprot:1575471-Pleurochrysis_carterae.AAC.1